MSETQEEYLEAIKQKRAESATMTRLAAMFEAHNDSVGVSKIFIDICGDLEAALVLDEIFFWTLPKKKTGQTSLRVRKNGVLWLAVRREDWWERKRLNKRQADLAIQKLIDIGMVEKDVFNFNGKPTMHLRIKMQNFIAPYIEQLSKLANDPEEDDSENLVRDISDLYEMMSISPKRNLQNGEGESPKRDSPSPNGDIINSLHTVTDKTSKPKLPENSDISWLIKAGANSTEIARLSEKEEKEKGVAARWEREMSYNPLPWWTDKNMGSLLRFLMDKTEEEVKTFAAWSRKEFSPLSPTQARKNPRLVIDLWQQAFPVKEPEKKHRHFHTEPDGTEVWEWR